MALSPPLNEGLERIVRCWELAVTIFNTELTSDPRKIIGGSSVSLGYPPSSYWSVVDTAQKIICDCPRERGDFRKGLENSLMMFNQYVGSIDILIQHQPHVTALVWGSVRTLIQIANKEIETSTIIVHEVGRVIGELGRWDQYLRLFPASDRLFRVTAQMFAQVINYLVRATAFYSAPLPKRYVKAGLSSAATKLQEILKQIKDLSLQLERESHLAGEEKHELARNEHNLQVSTLQDEQKTYRHESLTFMQSTVIFQHETLATITDLRTTIGTLNEKDDLRLKIYKLKQETERIISWLCPSRTYNALSTPWEPGTAEWILKHHVFREWDGSHHRRLLWIYGIPGSGKSVIASYLMQQSPSTIRIAHFIRAAVEERSTKSVTVAASILAQLLCDSNFISNLNLWSTLVDEILPFVDHFSSYEECKFDQIWGVFELVSHYLPPFTLVIDALDECRPLEDAGNLIMQLQRTSHLANARVIVLSRQHPKLVDLLRDSAQIEMDQTTLTDDMALYIQHTLKRTPRIRICSELIVRKVRDGARGMFLWTKLLLQHIKQGSTFQIQLDRLKKFPVGLSSIYEKFLDDTGRGLDTEQLMRRRNIFMLLTAATTPLSIDDISTALALESFNSGLNPENLLIEPAEQISDLCWPFTKISSGCVHFVHYSMQEFLLLQDKSRCDTNVQFTACESNAYMATLCLRRLLNLESRSIEVLGTLLRSRTGKDTTDVDVDPRDIPRRWTFYAYAAQNWFHHLENSAVSIGLLRLVSMFLKSPEFLAWVETFLADDDDMGPVARVRAAMHEWCLKLDNAHQEIIMISDFMGKPYNDFFERHDQWENAPEAPYLAMRRLGQYLNLTGRISGSRSSRDVRKLVAEGLRMTLGPRNPSTLRSMTDWAVELLVGVDRELCTGESMLLSTMKLQQEVVGLEVSDSYYTQQNVGLALYYQARFEHAVHHIELSCDGLSRTLGPNHQYCYFSRIYHAWALEGMHALENSSRIFESVGTDWSKVHGSEHPLSTMAQCSLGVVHRKLGRFRSAEKHLTDSLVQRLRTFDPCESMIDSSIHLALLYRSTNRTEEAHVYLDLAEDSCLSNFGFERYCQVQHLRALLHLDRQNREEAKKILQVLIKRSREHPLNRSVMWVRLTLADTLRSEEHYTKALSLFSDIFKASGSGKKNASRSKHQEHLRTAEQIIRAAKDSGLEVAEELMRSKGLQWHSPDCLWIIFGGPAADVF